MLLLHDGTKPQLRPYQQQVVADTHKAIAEGYRRPLIVAPTGAGKTILAAQLIDDFVNQGKTVLFVVHLDILVPQTAEKLELFGVDHGFIKAGYAERRYAPVQIASIQTLPRREWWKTHRFDVVIWDESHISSWSKISKEIFTKYYPHSIHIGLTGTPYRLSKKEGMGDLFNALIQAPLPRELMEMGYLVKPRYYTLPEADLSTVGTIAGDYDESSLAVACNKPELIDRIVAEWHRISPGRRTIAFGVDIKHAVAIAEGFRNAGVVSAVVTGETPRHERMALYKALADGSLTVLSSVNVLSVGFDVCAVETAILARPTQSKAMYFQQIGRVLRIASGKVEAIVLDQAGNVRKHGFVESIRKFSLTQGKDTSGDAPLKTCESHDETGKTNVHGTKDSDGNSLGCGALIYAFMVRCPHCRYRFPERAKAQLSSNLIELQVKSKQSRSETKQERSPHADHIDGLVRKAAEKGLKRGWVGYRALEIPNVTLDDLRYTAKILGYQSGWADIKMQELKEARNAVVNM